MKRRRIKLPAVHPGEVLREDSLVPMRLSAYAVARALGVPRTRIERFARGETPVTADAALRLAKYFGTTAGFWMNMQAQHDLERGGSARQGLRRIAPARATAAYYLDESPALGLLTKLKLMICARPESRAGFLILIAT